MVLVDSVMAIGLLSMVCGVRSVSGRCGSARNTPDVEAHAGGVLEQMVDDGELSHHAENVAIQRNTRHAWRNPSTHGPRHRVDRGGCRRLPKPVFAEVVCDNRLDDAGVSALAVRHGELNRQDLEKEGWQST
jgi:hypothetical protein